MNEDAECFVYLPLFTQLEQSQLSKRYIWSVCTGYFRKLTHVSSHVYHTVKIWEYTNNCHINLLEFASFMWAVHDWNYLPKEIVTAPLSSYVKIHFGNTEKKNWVNIVFYLLYSNMHCWIKHLYEACTIGFCIMFVFFILLLISFVYLFLHIHRTVRPMWALQVSV